LKLSSSIKSRIIPILYYGAGAGIGGVSIHGSLSMGG